MKMLINFERSNVFREEYVKGDDFLVQPEVRGSASPLVPQFNPRYYLTITYQLAGTTRA